MPTQGFQLSQFSRAPNVPGNIGVVDTKGIYDSVVNALKTHEALRTAQMVQGATDAELALATQKAQTEAGLLSPEAEARRAKANLLSASAPYEQSLLPVTTEAARAKGILSRATDTAALGGVATAQQAKTGKDLVTIAESEALNDPTIQKRLAEARISAKRPAAVRAHEYYNSVIADPESTPEEVEQAKIALKTALNAGQRVPRTFPLDTPEGRRFVAFDPVTQTAAFVSETPAAAPGVAAPTAPSAAPVTGAARAPATAPAAAPQRIVGITPAQETQQREQAKHLEDLRAKLPVIKRGLDTLNLDMGTFNATAEEAIKEIEANPHLAASWGSLSAALPGTPAYRLAGYIETLRAKEAFSTLAELRKNSPTGGALGNVSDREEQMLSAAIASLRQGLDAETLIKNIRNIQAYRKAIQQNWMSAYAEDAQRAMGGSTASAAPKTAAPAGGLPQFTPSGSMAPAGVPKASGAPAPAAGTALTADDLVKMYTQPVK